MAGKLVSLNEAAEMLGMTPDQLVEMRQHNEIHGYRDGTSWKFKVEEVERVADERGIQIPGRGGLGDLGLVIEGSSLNLADSSFTGLDGDLGLSGGDSALAPPELNVADGSADVTEDQAPTGESDVGVGGGSDLAETGSSDLGGDAGSDLGSDLDDIIDLTADTDDGSAISDLSSELEAAASPASDDATSDLDAIIDLTAGEEELSTQGSSDLEATLEMTAGDDAVSAAGSGVGSDLEAALELTAGDDALEGGSEMGSDLQAALDLSDSVSEGDDVIDLDQPLDAVDGGSALASDLGSDLAAALEADAASSDVLDAAGQGPDGSELGSDLAAALDMGSDHALDEEGYPSSGEADSDLGAALDAIGATSEDVVSGTDFIPGDGSDLGSALASALDMADVEPADTSADDQVALGDAGEWVDEEGSEATSEDSDFGSDMQMELDLTDSAAGSDAVSAAEAVVEEIDLALDGEAEASEPAAAPTAPRADSDPDVEALMDSSISPEAPADDDSIDSILVSEESLGHSGEMTSSTIIGKASRVVDAEDVELGGDSGEVEIASDAVGSDMNLVAGGSSVLGAEEDVLNADTGIDSDVSLVPAADGSGVNLIAGDSEILDDDDLALDGGTSIGSDVELVDDAAASGVNLVVGGSDIVSGSDVLIGEEREGSTGGGSTGGGSGTGKLVADGSDVSIADEDLELALDSELSLTDDEEVSLDGEEIASDDDEDLIGVGDAALDISGDASEDDDLDAMLADSVAASDLELDADSADMGDDLQLDADSADFGDDLQLDVDSAVGDDLQLDADSGVGDDLELDDSRGLSLDEADDDDFGEIMDGGLVADSAGLGSGIGSGIGSDIGSDIELEDDDDDDLDVMLAGSAAGSDLTLGSDSGINLSPTDSGLSLEEEPLDLGGSSIEQLELPEDEDMISLEEEAPVADQDAATQLKADDEFLLTPIEEAEDESSGSQVIALEDSEVYADENAQTMLGAAAPAADMGQQPLVAEDADFLLTPSQQQPDQAPAATAQPVAMVGPAPTHTLPEAKYSIFNVMGLMLVLVVLGITGPLMVDLMRNLWEYNQPVAASSSLIDSIIKAINLQP